jgi:tetratricopeptide (TPR) repeat protein
MLAIAKSDKEIGSRALRGGTEAPAQRDPERTPPPPVQGSRCFALMRLMYICLALTTGYLKGLAGEAPVNSNFVVRAQRIFLEARAQHEAKPLDVGLAWQFGKACFDRAEFATNDDERASLAVQGVAVCRQALERASNSAPTHYYLGMNLGQLARTKSLGALKIVGEMEREFEAARRLDEHFDYSGPDRNLGLLYHEAPGWPASIGSHSKARLHLRRAVELAPDYPENRLNLLEADLQWSDRADARQQLKALEELLPKARTELSGDAWAPSWSDWDARLTVAHKKLEDLGRPIQSPRNKSGN